MYKVFLVDDEIVIRENIRSSFPSSFLGGIPRFRVSNILSP